MGFILLGPTLIELTSGSPVEAMLCAGLVFFHPPFSCPPPPPERGAVGDRNYCFGFNLDAVDFILFLPLISGLGENRGGHRRGGMIWLPPHLSVPFT